MSDAMSRTLGPDARDAFPRNGDGRAASRRAPASCASAARVSRSGKGRGAAGNAREFGILMSRDWKQEKGVCRRHFIMRRRARAPPPSPLPRVRSRRRRVRHASPRRLVALHFFPAFLACLASCGLKLSSFVTFTAAAAPAFRFSISATAAAPSAPDAARLCLLRVFRGFLRGHRGGVSVEGWTGAFVRGFGESATHYAIDRYAYPDGADERATTDRSIVRLNAKGTGVVGVRSIGTDRVDSRTRDARSRRRGTFARREPTRRVRSCQGTRERDEKSRPAPLRSGLGGQALRVALVATLLLLQILLFGLLAAQTTRHVVELGVRKESGGEATGFEPGRLVRTRCAH